ncbi:MAG: hypothetical protein KC731_23430 [Myxococcales bacterium]|nr:hypothetical protein [Myxococcales bacterium]
MTALERLTARATRLREETLVACDLVFITGDPSQRSETADVAVILEQLLRADPELRLGIVDRAAEPALRERWGVKLVPSVVVPATGRVLPRVAPWVDYMSAFEEARGGRT